MELVNICEPQGERKQETVRGGSHKSLARASKDSGNGSQSFEESQQNGDIVTQHLSREKEPSGDEETKKVQNSFYSRSVECNGVQQGIVSDKSSSSNCFDSSCGLKHPAKKLERQDNVHIPLQQDHPGNSLQTPAVICSCKNSCSEKQGGNFNAHSADIFESPEEGKQSHESASERNQEIMISQTHLAVEERDSDNIQRLPHQSQPSASSELQNKMPEGSEISPAGLHQGNIPRCSFAPCSPENMFSHPKEFMSLPVSPSDLVPKHIMNSLGRELIRERLNVIKLRVEKKHLSVECCELSKRNQYLAAQYNRSIQALTIRNNNILCLNWARESWQKKVSEKEKELATEQQRLNDCKETCRQLQSQHDALDKKLQEEERKSKKLNNDYHNLEQTLKKERTRFARDENCLQEKIGELKKENQWLREGLAEYQDCPMSVTPKHTETESHVIQSNETQLKGVYSENNVCQTQLTSSKQNPKKSIDYKTKQTDLASPKLKCIKPNSQKTILSDVEKSSCPNCYKEDFKSNSEFMQHIGKCEV